MPSASLSTRPSTEHFTFSEPQNPAIDVTELNKIGRSPDFEAIEMWNVI